MANGPARDPRTGKFVSRGSKPGTSIVPRPNYGGVRVTGGTAINPTDPGWRYGGPDWRPGGRSGPRPADAARAARNVPRPGTSVVPRTPSPGTALESRSSYLRNTARAAGRQAGAKYGIPFRPTRGATALKGLKGAGRVAGGVAGRAAGPVSAALLGIELGGAAGTTAYKNSPAYRGMIENLSETPVLGEFLGRTGAFMSGDFGDAFGSEGPDETPTNYTSELDLQRHLAQQTREREEDKAERQRQAASGRLARGGEDKSLAEIYEERDFDRGPTHPATGQVAERAQDPFEEFMNQQISELASAYDEQIETIGGLGDIYAEQAQEAQGNIGDFFGHAGDVAREGIPVTQEVYEGAQKNVGGIYDDLGGRLESMPQRLTDTATEAAGGQVSGSVAERVAEATAPFAAAGESARAGATANLEQHSSAGQNYLNQLASATGSEGALHQSNVEQALNQQQQLIAHRQAELEGAKQRAIMDISADISGSSSEMMAEQALAQALGIEGLPPGVAVDDYLGAQEQLQNLGGGGQSVEDQIELQRDLIGLEQAGVNLEQDLNPQYHQDRVIQNLSTPAQTALTEIMNTVDRAGGYQNEEQRMTAMLNELDNLAAEGGLTPDVSQVIQPLGTQEVNIDEFTQGEEATMKELEEAIRRLTNQG